MITLKYTFENIGPDFYANKNFVFYRDGDVLKVISANEVEEVAVTGLSRFSLSVLNSHTLVRTKDFVQLLNDELKREKEYCFSETTSKQLLDISGQLKLLVNEAKEDYREVRLYDGLTSEVVYERYHHDLARIIGDDYLLLLKKSFLKCISISSGDVVWESDLVDYCFEQNSVLLNLKVDNGLLFLYAHDANWNNFGFRILNAFTGECVFSSSSFGPNFYLHGDIAFSVGRNTQEVQLMSIDTFDITKVDLSFELGDFVFETQCAPYFYGNNLYVALKKNGEAVYSFWGIIDLMTNKLTYITEMLRDFSKAPTKNNKTFVSQIKANSTLIAVKVPGNTLHIFERA